MFLSPLVERLGEGVQHKDCLLHHPLTQPLPQGGEESDSSEETECAYGTWLGYVCRSF